MRCPHETQRPVSALRDADARCCPNLERGLLFPFAEGQISPVQPGPILPSTDSKRLSQFPRPIRKPDRGSVPVAAFVHEVKTRERLESTNQHTTGRSFAICNNVQTLMHAIDEIDVRMPCGPEQHFRPFR